MPAPAPACHHRVVAIPLDRRAGDLVQRWRFARSATERVATGVAGGLAEQTGVDPYVLRIALVVTTLAGGLGVLAYATAAARSVAPSDGSAIRRANAANLADAHRTGARTLAVLCGSGAVLVSARSIGLWPGDGLMLPVLAVAGASGLVWWRSGQGASTADPFERLLSGRTGPLRLAAGLVLGLVGLVALTGTAGVRSMPRAAAALVLALGGVLVVAGPFVGRLLQQVGDEQRQRIRTEERAEVAAHLHDSVLQTLALMQRANDDPRRMTVLARRQERELRAWLYGGRTGGPATGTVAGDAEAMIAELEYDHGLGIDLVVVGERDGLVLALRNLLDNAIKFTAGRADRAIEVGARRAQGQALFWVRDNGPGFDMRYHDRIFEIFQRLHRAEDFPGTGVGLAIVRKAVERMHGKVWAESAKGEGATFYIQLPAGAQDPEQKAEHVT